MDTLAGRTALLTGASGGIGSHIAQALGRQGVRLALSGRNVDALEKVADRVRDAGSDATVVAADLADLGAADRLVHEAEEAVGPLDILVNNAGVESPAAYTDLTLEEIDRYVAVNLTAAMVLTRRALPGMLARGRGHVVTIASIAGKGPIPYDAPYAATKAGLIGLTRSLRVEYAETPVRFSVVCPGFVDGEGMYGRMVADGYRSPALLGSSSPAKVVDAVIASIVRDRAETVVNPLPLRPLFALEELLPGIGGRIVTLIGTRRMFAGLADRHHRVS
jgi:short-subunit dehydrogenase